MVSTVQDQELQRHCHTQYLVSNFLSAVTRKVKQDVQYYRVLQGSQASEKESETAMQMSTISYQDS